MCYRIRTTDLGKNFSGDFTGVGMTEALQNQNYRYGEKIAHIYVNSYFYRSQVTSWKLIRVFQSILLPNDLEKHLKFPGQV
jgi:hypothetical protein